MNGGLKTEISNYLSVFYLVPIELKSIPDYPALGTYYISNI